MKELSIEEKAKAYDLALERAKKWLNAPNIDKMPTYGNRIIEEIFPELKESGSKDERIKKTLISYFAAVKSEEIWDDDISFGDILAWLEKQGKIVAYYEDRLDECACKYFNKGYKHALEKQDGQKPQGKSALEAIKEEKVDNANKVEPKDYNSIDPHFGKPADKVEPKFQNGQWIVWQGKYYKVNDNGCGYELVDQNGLNTSLEYGTVNESAHVWDTTKDAKDGDVLVASDGSIFLFKGTIDCVCKHYAALTTDGTVKFNKGLEHFWETSTAVHPAIKEQRETLFKTMHEAGYEWDAEKKELKKISQRIISAEAKEAMYGKPTAWSEEDELKRSTLIHVVKKLQGSAIFEGLLPEELIAWLKSLKQRIKL